jgi:hypothetical protein
MYSLLLAIFRAVAPAAFAQQKGIPLLEPVGNVKEIPNGLQGLGAVFFYFNLLWPWLLGVAGGMCVLMTVMGGIQIILSGGDPGKREEGTSRFLWSLAGLLVIIFAGLVLRTLNPSFYK